MFSEKDVRVWEQHRRDLLREAEQNRIVHKRWHATGRYRGIVARSPGWQDCGARMQSRVTPRIRHMVLWAIRT
jgi:hypothetical protein